MTALRMPVPVGLELSVSGLGVEPLDRQELARVNGGAYFMAGCLVAAGIGGVFVAAAIIAASYYVFTHTW